MATLFIDYENGDDNYGGTSFALLASGTNGRITSTTFSAATANFPNDGSLINQYISIFNGTSYPTYIITAWISSTSLTIAAISGGTALANQAVDRQYYIGGRWKTISTTGATAARLVPGDTIRIMGSPEPTIVGSGTWSTLTGSAGAGTSNINTATNASPIVLNCASSMATLNISNGDTVLVTTAGGNTNANGVWEVSGVSGSNCSLVGSSGNATYTGGGFLRKITHRVVKLNSAVTANIASYGNRGNSRTIWTQSTNVTTSFNTTDSKEGDVSDSIAVGASFTTGKAAYKSTGTLNLSGYQQLSFYIKQTSGTVAVSGDVSLRLCSDTIGDTVVHTFNIPGLVALNQWIPITINLGSAMNSSIQSIALYRDVNRGAQTFLLCNILACKSSSSADSLNLQSLISKNTGDELWYPIMSINDTRIVIDAGVNNNNSPITSASRGGYYGTTENITTYKRETIKTAMASSAGAIVQEIQEAGTAAASFNYEFGWDRTNMSTQNLRSYFDGLNGLGYGLLLNTKNYVNINNIAGVRYDRGVRFVTSNYGNHGLLEGIATTNAGIDLSSSQSENTYSTLRAAANSSFGVFHDFGCNGNIYQKIITIGNLAQGVYSSRGFANNKINYILSATNSYGMFFEGGGTDNIYTSGNFIQNSNDGVRYYSSNNESFINCLSSGNATNYGFYTFGGDVYLKNTIVNESLECLIGGFSNGRIYSHNHDNASGNHIIFTDYGLITAQTSVRYTSSGYAWSMSPTSTFRSSIYPLDFPIAKVAVNANSLVTVKAWMRRTNTGLTTGLRIKGAQIAGVSNDITSYMSAAANTWEQVTLTFTPTEIGVVEILAECYGGNTFTAYVDDISITQV